MSPVGCGTACAAEPKWPVPPMKNGWQGLVWKKLSRFQRGEDRAAYFALCKSRRLCYTLRARELLCRLFLGSSAVEHSTVNRMVAGSNPARGANHDRSVPDTWVTVDTGDMGNILVVWCHRALAKPLACYSAVGARFASGFASAASASEPAAGLITLAPNGFGSGSSLQVSSSKYPRS